MLLHQAAESTLWQTKHDAVRLITLWAAAYGGSAAWLAMIVVLGTQPGRQSSLIITLLAAAIWAAISVDRLTKSTAPWRIYAMWLAIFSILPLLALILEPQHDTFSRWLSPHNLVDDLILASLAMATLSAIGAALSFILYSAFRLRWRRNVRLKPNDELISAIAGAFWRTTVSGLSPRQMGSRPSEMRRLRRAAVALLEYAARVAESDMPLSMPGMGTAPRSVFRHKCEELASTLRSLEVDVALQGDKSTDTLADKTAKLLVPLVLHEYDSIPTQTATQDAGTGQLVKLESRRSMKDRIVSGTRMMLAITAPFLSLDLVKLCATVFGIEPSSTVYNYLLVGSSLWLVISLLSIIDPHYETKATMITDIWSGQRHRPGT